MSIQFRLSKPAEKDLEDIFDYSLNTFGLDQTLKYISSLELIFNKLAINPSIGRTRNEIKTELLSFNYKSHVVFYRVKLNQIIVIRILHSIRDLPSYFK